MLHSHIDVFLVLSLLLSLNIHKKSFKKKGKIKFKTLRNAISIKFRANSFNKD